MSNQRALGLKAFERPKGYFKMSARSQWDSDSILGILDWDGTGLTKDEIEKLKKHCR